MQRRDDFVSVELRAARASRRHNGNGNVPIPLHGRQPEQSQPDSPFPFLETLTMKAKESPFLVVGIMISIAAIIVGAVMSLTVGFGIFVFSMNGTMHEIKAKQDTILEQLSTTAMDVDNMGTAMRAYEAANGKRAEFIAGLMTRDKQRAINEYDQAHPLPRMPEKKRN